MKKSVSASESRGVTLFYLANRSACRNKRQGTYPVAYWHREASAVYRRGCLIDDNYNSVAVKSFRKEVVFSKFLAIRTAK
jgi:hypothetical protein